MIQDKVSRLDQISRVDGTDGGGDYRGRGRTNATLEHIPTIQIKEVKSQLPNLLIPYMKFPFLT